MSSRRFINPLTSPIHFHTAMIEQIPAAVSMGQEMIGSKKMKVSPFGEIVKGGRDERDRI